MTESTFNTEQQNYDNQQEPDGLTPAERLGMKESEFYQAIELGIINRNGRE